MSTGLLGDEGNAVEIDIDERTRYAIGAPLPKGCAAAFDP
jgi:hypothetical protein